MDNNAINSLTVELREAKSILNQLLTKFFAQTRYASDNIPFRQQRFVIPLERNDPTTGLPIGTPNNPFKMGFPITSLRCETATDNATEIKVSINGDTTQQLENYTVMKNNDVMNFEAPNKGLFLTWDDQPGATITLIAYVDVKFESGSQVSTVAGGVNITTGSGMTPETPVNVDDTATLIIAADVDRKTATIGNPRSSGADVWISGTNSVTDELGVLPGILLEPGDYYVYQGQGDIYGICLSGQQVDVTLQTEV